MKSKKSLKSTAAQMLGILSLAFLVVGFVSAAKPSAQSTEAETCTECHEDVVIAMPHAEAVTCTACHGSAEKHLEEGGGPNIFSFKDKDLPNEKTKQCLTCHSKNHAGYLSSPHGKSSMDCTACHTSHTKTPYPALLKTSSTKNCMVCHGDVFSLFQLNERHRLQEGIMSCTTCHDPHESSARERLAGFKHESCLKCHTDKGGPFVFEHGASRVEGCSSCHDVHGSPHRHMLTHRSTSDLCFSCHVGAVSWHSRFTSEGTNCAVCHSTIHGSNLDHLFLK